MGLDKWWRGRRRDDDLDQEIEAHLRMAAGDRMGRGELPGQARHSALREFGNATLVKEMAREVWSWSSLERLQQDFQFGIRTLAKSPGFTAVVVLTLALGIGANTAIFSVVNAVLFQPLPYPQPSRLVMLWEKSSKESAELNFVAPADFRDWKTQSRAFDRLAAFIHTTFTITGGDRPERVAGEVISPELFAILGVSPALGRGFLAEDEQQVPYTRVILSDGIWQRRFGGDPGAVGKTLVSEGRKLTIVGVMPRDFNFPAGLIRTPPEIWVPLARPPKEWTIRDFHYLRVVGRLRAGVSLPAAAAEMKALQSRLSESNPAMDGEVQLNSLQSEMVGDVETPLLVLFGAVAFVLLIACVNVANLMLSRGSARQREFAIRFALGAGRNRIVRQLCTESLVLSVLGGGLGVLLGGWAVRAVVALAPANIPRLASVRVDSEVLLFTLILSLAAGLLSGLSPAMGIASFETGEQLKGGGRGSVGEPARQRLRSMLVVAEIAIAIVLVTGASLMIRSLYRLGQVKPGFRTDKILTFFVSIPDARYHCGSGAPACESQASFFRDWTARIEAIPGVESVGATTALPLSGTNASYTFVLEGRARVPGQPSMSADYRAVTTGYFHTLGIPLVRGRTFDDRDSAQSAPVVAINEALARRYFPAGDPIGQRIHVGHDRRPGMSEIVGVVGDVRHLGLAGQPSPEMYEPFEQATGPGLTFAVRASGDPRNLIGAIREALRSIDPNVPVSKVMTMDDLLGDALAPSWFRSVLLGSFAAFALVLAALGIYGVMAYTVNRQIGEIDLRMALGARPEQVLGLIVGRALRLTLAGVIAGSLAALWLTRYLQGLLFGIGTTDGVTFLSTDVILLLVAMAASYLPAWRAARVDPVEALRRE